MKEEDVPQNSLNHITSPPIPKTNNTHNFKELLVIFRGPLTEITTANKHTFFIEVTCTYFLHVNTNYNDLTGVAYTDTLACITNY